MRTALTLLVALAVVGGATAPAVATAVERGGGPPIAPPEGPGISGPINGSDVSPGQQLAGVVGVQETELRGELQSRSLAQRLNASETADGKAEVVADQVGELRDRLQDLQERRAELVAAKNNGSISVGEFRAKMAVLATNVSTTQNLLNATASASAGLPADVLEANGVNVSAIQQLRNKASELTGPEVAAIARSIAGPDTGKSLGGPPPFAGPPNGTPGNGSAGPPNGTPGGNASDGGPPNGTPGDGNAGPPNGTPGGNASDGSPPNGTPGDGSAGDGGDGTPGDGAPNGTPTDGNAGDGSSSDGGASDGSDGSASDGSNGGSDGSDGSASDGSNGDSDGSNGGSDGSDGSASDGSNGGSGGDGGTSGGNGSGGNGGGSGPPVFLGHAG